jgi:hypothetical protein
MKETFGEDLFDQISIADGICIPTNCTIDNDGSNIMGACAGAAAMRWEEIPSIYGRILNFSPNVPVILGYINKADHSEFCSALVDPEDVPAWLEGNDLFTRLIAFPTMHEIGQPASLELVIRSAQLLVELANLCYLDSVYLASPGTGVGGLAVEEVHGALRSILDDRFTVMRK